MARLQACLDAALMNIEFEGEPRMDLRTAFRLVGPNIRRLEYLSIGKHDEELVIGMIKTVLDTLDMRQLERLLRSHHTAEDSTLHSHVLITTYRAPGDAEQEAMRHRISSKTILRLIHAEAIQKNAVELQHMYTIFAASSGLSIPRGWAFEILCHRLFTKKPASNYTFTLTRMKVHQSQLIPDHNDQTDWSVVTRQLVHFSTGQTTQATSSLKSYFVPSQGNNPTFDSFLHMETPPRLVGLQMTIASKHSIKKSGLDQLRRRQLPGESNPWMIYIIPQGHSIQLPHLNKSPFNQFTFFACEVEVGNNDWEEADNETDEDSEPEE
ncbi:SET domain-containing protein [Mycena indigotica]|uniref:SET domain-containing protein n=1 Tax=Mycena indigotica TaxID=2126181 RepID=A0A8H6S894_9AGAR|nr:SET domain-containing protein [Mycena indigotica]KAF7294741.1 SET domain-containing protein [Mycena indigotica]